MENGYIFPLGGNSGGGGTGGESTIAWKPTVTEDGDLSWSRSQSTTAPTTQNIRGPQGLPGDDGTTFTPEIGTVTTVDSTEEARASVSVDADTGKAIFDFSIPRGEKGDGADSVDLISDDEVVTDKTYSSAKIEVALAETLEAGKTYTLEEVAKALTASYKVVSSVDEVLETKWIYLIANDDTYDMYIFEESTGNAVKIGNTKIDLTDYYTKGEIDAFITAINQEIANMYVAKSSVVTSLDDTATDNQVISAKAVQDWIKDRKLKNYAISTINGDETANDLGVITATLQAIADKLPACSVVMIDSAIDTVNYFGLPDAYYCIFWVRRYQGRDMIIAQKRLTSEFYVCTNVTNQKWSKVCTASVADVPVTNAIIDTSDTDLLTTDISGVTYMVRNGICYVDVANIGLVTNPTKTCGVNFASLPKPAMIYRGAILRKSGSSAYLGGIYVDLLGTASLWCETTAKGICGVSSFSYPVAE